MNAKPTFGFASDAVRRSAVPWLVLFISLSMTIVAAYMTYRSAESAEHAAFDVEQDEAVDSIKNRFSEYRSNLQAGAGLYYAAGIDDAKWQALVSELGVEDDPGLLGVGFIRRASPDEKPRIEEFMRREGYRDFAIHPEGARDEYYPILYLRPLDERNLTAVGFDMSSESVRREAMERARDTGAVSMSSVVTLVQEIYEDKQSGFLMFKPVYRKGRSTSTVAERRAALEGFVYSPIRAGDFFSTALEGVLDPAVSVRIYDSSSSFLVFATPRTAGLPGSHRSVKSIQVDGRMIKLEFEAPKGFAGSGGGIVPYLLLGGILLSFVLFALTRAQIEEKNRAERSALRLAFLAEASRVLTGSLDYEETLRNVAKAAVPSMADWCTIRILGQDGETKYIVEHKDPEMVEWAVQMGNQLTSRPGEDYGSMKVMRTGRTEFAPVVTPGMLAAVARDAGQLEMLLNMGLSSVIIVPLSSRGRTMGTISFVSAESGVYYTDDDVSVAEDLGRRASLAIENARLFDEVKKAVIVRDDFMATASHELKTPLTSQKILIDYLKRKAAQEGNAGYVDILGKLDAQTSRLTNLIVDLIDVAKLEAGKMAFKMERIDLDEVVRAAVEETKLLNRHAILIEGGVTRAVCADRERVRQVLVNLISNAVKYSPEADSVSVRIADDGRFARVAVQDYGIGIDPEHQESLFTRFYRVSGSDERTFPGMGLGLFISSEIIRRHGGKIWVESEKGKGSTFYFTLPFA